MAQNKTQPNAANVDDFINAVEDESKRNDCRRLIDLMSGVTKAPPVLWGTSIVGFGEYHYKYDSGREGDFMITGFAPRKQNLSIYIMTGFDRHENLMKKLGKYKIGKSCLYVKTLVDIDETILQELVSESVSIMRKEYPTK